MIQGKPIHLERDNQLTYANYGQSCLYTHTPQQTPGAHYNNITDSLSKLHVCSKALYERPPKISDTALDTTIPPKMSYPPAEWVHITSDHRWVTALTDWACCSYISLILALTKLVVNNYLPLFPKKTLEGSGRHVSPGETDPTHNGKLTWVGWCQPLLKLLSTQPQSLIPSLGSWPPPSMSSPS